MKQKPLDLEVLDELSIKCVPNNLPQPLIDYVQKLIDSIKSIQQNPLEEYNRKYNFYKNYPFFSDEYVRKKYNESIKELNRYNSRFSLITDNEMIAIWNKFYELKPTCLPTLFSAIVHFSSGCRKITFDSNIEEHLLRYSELRQDPSEVINTAESLCNYLEEFIGLIAPEGSDCFEYMDVTDPNNKMFLTDGKIPYSFNWDFYITDDEYDEFIFMLKKIIDKLKNRRDANKSEKANIIKDLEHPVSRKRKIENAKEIEFIKCLYVRFMEIFNKPLYAEISTISNLIFNGIYTDSDIIQLTKKARSKMNKLKKIIKKDGFINMNNTSHLESMIAKHLIK